MLQHGQTVMHLRHTMIVSGTTGPSPVTYLIYYRGNPCKKKSKITFSYT